MNALILVDVQNDFMPGGALAVPDGDGVVPIINEMIPQFDLVVATQDYHPTDHISFAANWKQHEVGDVVDVNGTSQILWPIHCVEDSKGAQFHPDIETDRIEEVFPKGCDRKVDSYSGFFDNDHKTETGLGNYLKAKGVNEVSVVGLAADYCVKFTALDAAQLGFRTNLILDATRGVNLNEDDVDRAVQEMEQAGVRIIRDANHLPAR